MTDGSWVGRSFVVDVERVAHGGHCVARYDGRVIFVRHTLPGERVRVAVTEDKGGSFCRADAIEVLTASAHRVAVRCEYAEPGGCGGCDWQHVEVPEQRRLKAAVVAEQLQRLAGIEYDVEVEAVAPTPVGWRTRMQYATDGDRVGLRAHRSHDLIDIDRCMIAAPDVDVTVARAHARRGLRVIEVETGDGGDVAVSGVDARKRRHTLAGGPQRHRVAGRDYRVRTGGFWQVHHGAAETLVGVVREFVKAQPGERVLDLFCGVGLFTAALGVDVGPTGHVLGLEGSASAVRDGQHNVADLPQCQIERAAIDAATIAALDTEVDVIVLDPPRAGAKRPLVEALCDRAPRTIAYVACDPSALARDLAVFAERGWHLDQLRAFDLFPMTHHVECVALLTRR